MFLKFLCYPGTLLNVFEMLMLSRYTYTSDERFRAIHKVSSHPFHFLCKIFCLSFQYFLFVISISDICHFNISNLLFLHKVLSEDYLLQILPVKVIVVVLMMKKKQIMMKKIKKQMNAIFLVQWFL